MSSSISPRERILRLNRFLCANPRRSVWALRSWINDSTLESPSPELIKVLHLVLSLDESSRKLLKDLFSPQELTLINIGLESAVTLGSQSTESLIYEFYERCQTYQSAVITESRSTDESLPKSRRGKEPSTASSPPPADGETFSRLKKVNSEQIAHVLQREQSQVIATVIAHLGAVKGAEILATFDAKEQSQICQRISTLSPVSPEWLRELEVVLLVESKRVASAGKTQQVPHLAKLLTHLPDQGATTLLAELDEHRSTLAEQLREQMFTFDDLTCVEDRGMQTLLSHIDQKWLRIALRGASESVREKIFTNLSERAQAMLQEDLDQSPPQRLSEVQSAQAEIIEVALDLERRGEILIDHPLCDQSFIR